jgi:hypothetical protein
LITRGVIFAIIGFCVTAQQARPESLKEDSSRSILATVEVLLRAMRNGDAAAAASVLHRDYRVVSWHGSGADREVFVDTRDGELAAIGKLKPGEWDVRFLRTHVSVDSNGLANVWARYEFYYFGKLDHCGVESYELFRTRERWWIINFSDTDTPTQGRSTSAVCPE